MAYNFCHSSFSTPFSTSNKVPFMDSSLSRGNTNTAIINGLVEGKVVATGSGINKKDARRNTAVKALEMLKDRNKVIIKGLTIYEPVAGEGNPVGTLNESVQKSRKKIDYQDLGHKVEQGQAASISIQTIAVVIEGKVVATGNGINKKDAKKNAAVKALEILKHSQPCVTKKVFIKGLTIYEPVGGEGNPVAILNGSVQKSRKKIDYYYKEELGHSHKIVEPGQAQGQNSFSCTVVIEGKVLATGSGITKKDARRNTAVKVLEILRDSQPSVTKKVAGSRNEVETIEKGDLLKAAYQKASKIDESNIGNQLLRKMGWTGSGGLGKDEDGISEPIFVDGVNGRKGFGQDNAQKTIKQNSVEHILMKFIREQEEEIKFSSDLSKVERALIHRISRKYGLRVSHKTFGIGADRYLVIRK